MRGLIFAMVVGVMLVGCSTMEKAGDQAEYYAVKATNSSKADAYHKPTNDFDISDYFWILDHL